MPASPNRSSSSSSSAARDNVRTSSTTRTAHDSRHSNHTSPPSITGGNPIMARLQTRRESRPITSIATTTAVPSTSIPRHSRLGGGPTVSPVATRTEDTTFSLPIEIIDTPDLDELCLSPVGSAHGSRPPSPLSSTPVCPPLYPICCNAEEL
jgi:hypothetical protein